MRGEGEIGREARGREEGRKGRREREKVLVLGDIEGERSLII